MVSFVIDMESEAMLMLKRVANLPDRHLHRALSNEAADHVRSTYVRKWHKRRSIYQNAKEALLAPRDSIKGILSGSTLSGITATATKLIGLVSLKGRWPGPVNIKKHVPLEVLTREIIQPVGEGDRERSINLENLMSGPRAIPSIGATVSLTSSGGFQIKWDKPLKSHFKDTHVRPQRLEGKQYGEFGMARDFMYLTQDQVNELFLYAERLMDMIIGNRSVVPIKEQKKDLELQHLEEAQRQDTDWVVGDIGFGFSEEGF